MIMHLELYLFEKDEKNNRYVRVCRYPGKCFGLQVPSLYKHTYTFLSHFISMYLKQITSPHPGFKLYRYYLSFCLQEKKKNCNNKRKTKIRSSPWEIYAFPLLFPPPPSSISPPSRVHISFFFSFLWGIFFAFVYTLVFSLFRAKKKCR